MRLSVRSRAWETIGVAALLCLSAGARTAHAQVAGAIRGKVTDGATQRPLDGVHVILVAANQEARTDATGTFAFRGIAAGSYTRR